MNETDIAYIREQLSTPKGVGLLKKALCNRAYRFTLSRQGALELVEAELIQAENKLKENKQQ